MEKLKNVASYLNDRLKEPSSLVGLSTILISFGSVISPDAAIWILTSITGLIGVLIKDKE